jgi:hypothetical protein
MRVRSVAMKPTSKWSVRRVQCPEGKGRAGLLIEWKVEKGKKALHSLSCDDPGLHHYGGMDCKWYCLEQISRKKK